MLTVLYLIGTFICDLLFKSRQRLEAENLFLRHQLNIALRCGPHIGFNYAKRPAVRVWMTRRMPSLLDLTWIVRPETILRWHRAGFRTYWRWKSRGRVGRPTIDRELRDHPDDFLLLLDERTRRTSA